MKTHSHICMNAKKAYFGFRMQELERLEGSLTDYPNTIRTPWCLGSEHSHIQHVLIMHDFRASFCVGRGVGYNTMHLAATYWTHNQGTSEADGSLTIRKTHTHTKRHEGQQGNAAGTISQPGGNHPFWVSHQTGRQAPADELKRLRSRVAAYGRPARPNRDQSTKGWGGEGPGSGGPTTFPRHRLQPVHTGSPGLLTASGPGRVLAWSPVTECWHRAIDRGEQRGSSDPPHQLFFRFQTHFISCVRNKAQPWEPERNVVCRTSEQLSRGR